MSRILSGPVFHHAASVVTGWWWWAPSLAEAQRLEAHLWPSLVARSILHAPKRAAD